MEKVNLQIRKVVGILGFGKRMKLMARQFMSIPVRIKTKTNCQPPISMEENTVQGCYSSVINLYACKHSMNMKLPEKIPRTRILKWKLQIPLHPPKQLRHHPLIILKKKRRFKFLCQLSNKIGVIIYLTILGMDQKTQTKKYRN